MRTAVSLRKCMIFCEILHQNLRIGLISIKIRRFLTQRQRDNGSNQGPKRVEICAQQATLDGRVHASQKKFFSLQHHSVVNDERTAKGQ